MLLQMQKIKFHKTRDFIINYIPFDNNKKELLYDGSNIDDIAVSYLVWQKCGNIIQVVNFRVNDRYKNKGYGTKLLMNLIANAKCDDNIDSIELDDMTENAWDLSNNIYIKRGFAYKHCYPFPEMVLKLKN